MSHNCESDVTENSIFSCCCGPAVRCKLHIDWGVILLYTLQEIFCCVALHSMKMNGSLKTNIDVNIRIFDVPTINCLTILSPFTVCIFYVLFPFFYAICTCCRIKYVFTPTELHDNGPVRVCLDSIQHGCYWIKRHTNYTYEECWQRQEVSTDRSYNWNKFQTMPRESYR